MGSFPRGARCCLRVAKIEPLGAAAQSGRAPKAPPECLRYARPLDSPSSLAVVCRLETETMNMRPFTSRNGTTLSFSVLGLGLAPMGDLYELLDERTAIATVER